MTYPEVLENARRVLAPRCCVCPECDGRACAGRVPGPGGKGSGRTARRNWSYLHERLKLRQDALGVPGEAETACSLFGLTFSLPVFPAPIGMVAGNWSPALDEGSYARAVVQGARDAGSMAFTGGGPQDPCFFAPLEAIREAGGWGVPTLKPWRLELAEQRLALVEAAGAPAFAMDIDSAGLPHAGLSGEPMSAKTPEDLARLAGATGLPFVVKGIMTPESALRAAEAGVYAIVVSNHGGRVLDDGLSTAEVLPEIRAAVGNRVKVLVDGGIRTGADVCKVLALGADAALVGRPVAVAAYGGGAEGVRLYLEQLRAELQNALMMTGCRSLADLTPERVRIV